MSKTESVKSKKINKTKKTSKVGNAGRKRTSFQLKTAPNSEVFLSGSFNGWAEPGKKMADKNGDGTYSVTVYLPKGDYEYKYCINNEWHVDPECPKWVQNNFGTLNSLVTVN